MRDKLFAFFLDAVISKRGIMGYGAGADPGGCNGCASTRQSCKEIIEGKLPIIFCCKVFD